MQRREPPRVARSAILAIGPVACSDCPPDRAALRNLGPRARGGIGRRGRFRSCCRKMWGVESLRAHQPLSQRGSPQRFHRELSNVTIKTVETENEGLKRAFMLTIPAKDIEARVDQEVQRIAPQVRMPGFRPGKVTS